MGPRSTMADEKIKTSELKARKTVFGKRVATVKNKARELSVLCDISVSVICYGPDGELHHWPENPDDVRRMATSYRGLSHEARNKHALDLGGFLASEVNRADRADKRPKLASTDPHPDMDLETIGALSDDELRSLKSRIDSQLVELEQKLHSLEHGVDQTQKGLEGLEGFSRDENSGSASPEDDFFEGLEDLGCGLPGFRDDGLGHCVSEMPDFGPIPDFQFQQSGVFEYLAL